LKRLIQGRMLDQQDFLKIAVAAQTSAAIPVTSGTSRLRFGEPQPFSYEWLKSHAQDLAAAPYHAPAQPDPGIVAAIDYDTYGHLKYKPDSALYGDGQPGVFPITFQYVGQHFPKTVRMYAVEQGSRELAREIIYDPNYFEIPADSVAKHLPPDPSCFAGFWLREAKAGSTDWRREGRTRASWHLGSRNRVGAGQEWARRISGLCGLLVYAS